MRFYTIQRKFSCSLDLHIDWMYLDQCVVQDRVWSRNQVA
jgi:hypothetical protein